MNKRYYNDDSSNSKTKEEDSRGPEDYLTISFANPETSLGYIQLIEPKCKNSKFSQQKQQNNLSWREKWQQSKAKKIMR